MWYTFGRIHQTLKLTPAIKAGISEKPWTVEQILKMAEAHASAEGSDSN